MSRLDRRAVLQSMAAIPATGWAMRPAFAASADATFAAPAVLKRTHCVLRIATPAPDRAHGIADNAHRFCRLTERLSQGRVRFIGTATLDDPFKLLRAGEIDAVFGYEHAKVHLHPAFAFFAGLPGAHGFGFGKTHAWLEAGAQDLWNGLSAEFGFRSFLAGHTASPATLWSAEPMNSLADFSHQVLAVPGLGGEVVKGLGGVPHPQTEISLRQALGGEIRAAEAASISDIFNLCMTAKKTFVAESPFSKHGSTMSLTLAARYCGSAFADVLNTAIGHISELAARHESERRSNELLLKKMTIDRLAQPYRLNADVESAVQRITDAVLSDIASFDRHALKINSHWAQMEHPGAFTLRQKLSMSRT